MNNRKFIAAGLLKIALIGLLLQGCIDEVSFESDRSAGQLIVDGQITDQDGPHELRLRLTSDERTTPVPLNGASVTIIDGDGKKEDYVEAADGLYLLMSETVKGERGQTYYLEIDLPNGRRYRTHQETLPMAVGRDSAYFEVGTIQEQGSTGVIKNKNAVLVYADTEIPAHSDPVYLKWEVQDLFSLREVEPDSPFLFPKTCRITQYVEPQNILLFNTQHSDKRSLEKQLLATKRVYKHEFYRPHYFFVIISSITQRRYEYWKQVDELINSSGTVFDVPPAVVKGNVFNPENENEQVLGYFEAAVVDTAQFYTTRSDFPFFLPNPCGRSNPYKHYACDNCSVLEE